LNCPEQVLTVATLVCPSAPGNVSLIVDSFQDMGGNHLHEAAQVFWAGGLVACCDIFCVVASCSSSQITTFSTAAD
jgi:hypothetical protein